VQPWYRVVGKTYIEGEMESTALSEENWESENKGARSPSRAGVLLVGGIGR
jgi:hypothetical protein